MEAHKLCRQSKQHKRATILFEIELGRNIAKLIQALTTKTYQFSRYKTFTIYDPKVRLIEALPYKDRVVRMCFCKNVLEPRLEKRLIYDNAASRKGKGTNFAIQRLHEFMHRIYFQIHHNNAYFLKCDISKYFQNINHEILMSKLEKCGFSADELYFMRLVLNSRSQTGVPLGNQTSQWFALLYLDEIDRLVKEKLRASYYIRYMDDFVLLSPDKAFLQKCRSAIEQVCIEKLKLKLNDKTQIGKLKNGIDFLGFNHKLTATGAIVKKMRASSKERQRHYLKTISSYYLKDVLDDAYVDIRMNSFKAHLTGTKDLKMVRNRIQALKRKKKQMKKQSSLKPVDDF